MTASAGALAAARLAAIRDDPLGRLAFAGSMYEGGRGERQPFRRAALSFMRWEVQRGVLNPLDATAPGSEWWRALNDRLLLDACEAATLVDRGGEPSSPTVELWTAFMARPRARDWYRAHNASIATAYVEQLDLAQREGRVERFFLNVVLSRVLFAHALVAAPSLALGPLAPLSRALGDPRKGLAGAFLSMGRVLPDRYPAEGPLDEYLAAEHGFGRILDYGVIQPRLDSLYEWSAGELGRPELADLVVDGAPAYAWTAEDGHVWSPPGLSALAAAAMAATRAAPRSRAGPP